MTGDTPAEAAPVGREQLRERADATREELGRTLRELAAKADTKACAKSAVGSGMHVLRGVTADVVGGVEKAAIGLLRRAKVAGHHTTGCDP